MRLECTKYLTLCIQESPKNEYSGKDSAQTIVTKFSERKDTGRGEFKGL